MIWTDLYDEALYSEMYAAYESMMTSPDWESMLSSCRNLTDMVQRDYAALPGVQPPFYAFFRNDIKGIVMVTESHDLLWNYLYL